MKEKPPECFGDIETVFPKGESGLRHSPEMCLSCLHKTACLRSAMESTDGLAVKKEMVERAYTSGTMNFFQRWSRKKSLCHKQKEGAKHGQKRSGS